MNDILLHNKSTKLFISYSGVILLGLLVTAAAVYFGTFELKWAIFSILALLFPFVIFLVRDIKRFLMFSLIFSIPLNADYNFFLHPSTSGADAISIGLTDILLLMLLLQWIYQVTFSKQIGAIRFFPRLSLPAVAIILFSAISMLAARDLLWSTFDLLAFAKTFLFFFFLANNIQNRKDVSLVLNALFAGLLVQAVIIYFQYAKGSNLGLLGLGEPMRVLNFEMESANVSRPGGTIGHCNHLARYLGLIVPIAMTLTLTGENRWQRLFAGITSAAGIIGLIYTLTRSSWIALAVSSCVILFLIFKKGMVSFHTLAKIGLATGVFAAIILIFGNVIYGRLTSYDSGSAYTRWTTAKVALHILRDHPLTGVGINNYTSVLENYWLAEDSFTRKAAVHNTYLLYLAEIGIFGFGAFLWLLLAFFSSTKRAMKSRSLFFKIVSIGIMGSYFGYLLAAMGDKSYKENFTLLLIFWTLAAIVEAMNKLTYQAEAAFYTLLENENKIWIPETLPAS